VQLCLPKDASANMCAKLLQSAQYNAEQRSLKSFTLRFEATEHILGKLLELRTSGVYSKVDAIEMLMN